MVYKGGNSVRTSSVMSTKQVMLPVKDTKESGDAEGGCVDRKEAVYGSRDIRKKDKGSSGSGGYREKVKVWRRGREVC